MKKKLIFFAFVLACILVIPNVKVNATAYNYDFFKNAVYSSEGLAYKDTLYYENLFDGSTYDQEANPYFLGTKTNFATPTDMAVRYKGTATLDTTPDPLKTYYTKSIVASNNGSLRDGIWFYTEVPAEQLKANPQEADYYEVEKLIYILDGASSDNSDTTVKVNCKEGDNVDATLKKNSAIYVLNSEYKVIYSQNIFELTTEVKETLSSYYTTYKEEVTTNAKDATLKQIEAQMTIENDNHRCPFFNATISGAEKDVITLNCAEGICCQGQYIFVADTKNSRIVRLDTENNFMCDEVYLTPDDITFYQVNLDEDQSTRAVFQPSKIAVDTDGRVYTIAANTYQGIIEYKNNGDFNRFLGKNLVQKRSWWTFLLTEEQYESLALNLPSQFTNLVLDERNLLYATAKPNADATTATEMIKLINTSGKDVLKRNGYVKPDGDVNYARYVKPAVTGSSIFASIDINDAKIYSVVDTTRGRIFTYDDEGNLLYVSAEKGTLSNTLATPVALSYYENGGEEYVLVLDQLSKSILIYETTEFGKLVNEATRLYLNNFIEESQATWEQVVKMNSNYELGYVGIGKAQLRMANKMTDKDAQLAKYKEAMKNFKLGHNALYYSDAYKQYRNIILKDNFALIMTGLVVVVVAGLVLTFSKKNLEKNKRRAKGEEVDEEGIE